MAQPQGSSSTSAGRIDGSIGSALTAADSAFVLGAGWGTTATFAVAAGSNDQRGTITVTSSGTGQAQATANVTLTFKDGTYAGANAPTVLVQLQSSSNAVTEAQPTQIASTLTTMSFRHSVLPVAAATYRYSYVVIA
jgi:hypothetical protein